MRTIRIPYWIQSLFSTYTWRIPGDEKTIYLTFDDGPSPEITSWVLDQLESYQAKATFFLIGDKVQKHPGLVHDIIDAGHAVGHHTQNHVNGWKTYNKAYLKNAMTGFKTLSEYTGIKSRLYRPPYAKLTPSQGKSLSKMFDIIMMDVIAYDFDEDLCGEECFQNVIKYAKGGSIVVLHDSEKAWERLSYALPKILDHFYSRGYSFKVLEASEEVKDFDRELIS